MKMRLVGLIALLLFVAGCSNQAVLDDKDTFELHEQNIIYRDLTAKQN